MIGLMFCLIWIQLICDIFTCLVVSNPVKLEVSNKGSGTFQSKCLFSITKHHQIVRNWKVFYLDESHFTSLARWEDQNKKQRCQHFVLGLTQSNLEYFYTIMLLGQTMFSGSVWVWGYESLIERLSSNLFQLAQII